MPDEKKDAEIGEAKKEKRNEEEEKKAKGDFETWFPPIEFLETLNKDRIAIPSVSADKVAKVFQVLGKLIEKLPKKKLDWENISAADLLDLAPKLLREAPEEGIFIAATLLEKEPKWVRENLNFEMIFSLILPFVGREVKLFSKIGGLFDRLSPLAKL